MPARFDDPTLYPATAGLAARVRLALPGASDDSVKAHTDNLAGQSATYQDAYLKALGPASDDRQDGDPTQPAMLQRTEEDARNKARANIEELRQKNLWHLENLWRTPAGGRERRDAASPPVPTSRPATMTSAEAAAKFRADTEQAWQKPTVGVRQDSLR